MCVSKQTKSPVGNILTGEIFYIIKNSFIENMIPKFIQKHHPEPTPKNIQADVQL